ncbi:hypothetical protein AAFF_G00437140 [Aldrovandia affinis]|uniref:C2H2-type domain-containing protein n=1 Tax=Aldrovandia affinis TaxID=143900 RepID=A0AAD7WHX5_9TELE|nr:hypothetical protein AAFF_G00437140 [Aldrovandia affinis]
MEEEVKGRFVKEEPEEVEVPMGSPLEKTEDLKLEVKHEELQVSQNNEDAIIRNVKNEERISGALTQNRNPAQHTQRPYTRSGHGKTTAKWARKGERPYQCSQCGRTFSESRGLKKHKRIHTGERPYQCSQCDKRFIQSAHLTAHRRSHTGEKPYGCSQCGKSFSQSPHLSRHQRSHVGERLNSCTQCDKSFNEKGDLTKHMRTHTGEKPYYCSLCGKSFTYSTNLSKHKKVHR